MADYSVTVNFNDGTYSYDLSLVQNISDPKEGMKATVIKGIRGDGSIIIPGGKNSQEITIRGILFADDYKALTILMNEMRTKVTTDSAILTLKHKEGITWFTDWQRTVRRIDEIRFPKGRRIGTQEYEITFLQTAF